MARDWYGMPGMFEGAALPTGMSQLQAMGRPGDRGMFDLSQLGMQQESAIPQLGGMGGAPGGFENAIPQMGQMGGMPMAPAGAPTGGNGGMGGPPMTSERGFLSQQPQQPTPYSMAAQTSTLNAASKQANASYGIGVDKWIPLAQEVATEQGVDIDLIMAVMRAESNGNPDAVSYVGATGLMQLMPQTALGLGVTNIRDPKQNLTGGAKYLKQMLKQFNGDTTMAIAAYNAGPGGASNWRNIPETSKYVPKVQEYYNQAKQARGSATQTAASPMQEGATQEAMKHIGKPYIFGATGPTGFDCSGLTQAAFGRAGITLPRTAQQQWDATDRVAPQDARYGDLIFFHSTYNAGTYITHVGIYLGDGKMINAGSEKSGVQVMDMAGYWNNHLAGYGRPRGR